MSEQTKTALDAAIAAHVADETGSELVTGYVLCVAAQNLTDLESSRTKYHAEYATGQAYHSAVGLAEILVSEILPSTEDE